MTNLNDENLLKPSIETKKLHNDFVVLEEDQSNVSFNCWMNVLSNATKSKENTIYFNSIKYTDKSVYLWISDEKLKFQDLSCSIPTKYENEPVATSLIIGILTQIKKLLKILNFK
jgi:hypothetical protein